MFNTKKGYLPVILILLALAAISFSACQTKESDPSESERFAANNLEIERKWLIRESDIPYDLSKAGKYVIEQTYIVFSPEIRVRRINDGEIYLLTLKANMSADGLVRDEFEIEILEDEYLELFSKRDQDANTIYKTRYQLFDPELNQELAIDIFSGDLSGLAYLEIEFTSTLKAVEFTEPDWVIRDVTDRKEYKNGSLARYGMPADVLE